MKQGFFEHVYELSAPIMYWVRLQGLYVVERFSANVSENSDRGGPWGQQREIQNRTSLLVQLNSVRLLVGLILKCITYPVSY